MNLNVKIAIITLFAFSGMLVFLGSVFLPQIDFIMGFLGMFALWGVTAVLSVIFFVPSSVLQQQTPYSTPPYPLSPQPISDEKGIPVDSQHQTTVCPACGTPVVSGSNFCSACGATV